MTKSFTGRFRAWPRWRVEAVALDLPNERGLHGVPLVISDKCLGLWRLKEVARMLKAIHAQESHTAAREKATAVAEALEGMKLGKAAQTVREGAPETLSYYHYPGEHWRSLRTNNPMERIMREIRRRTRVVGAFPDGKSALMLVAARLRHVAGTQWGARCYLDMQKLREQEQQEFCVAV